MTRRAGFPKPAAAATKTCLNPHCGKAFVPGHYGDRQLVCTGSYEAQCKKCKGRDCKRCRGRGKYRETCVGWYRGYWSQTRKPPRSVPDEDFRRIVEELRRDVFWRAYVVVARESGLRKGEMLGLTWADVLDGDEIRTSTPIRGQWKDGEGFRPTKTNAGKTGFLLQEARKALEEMLASTGKSGDWRAARIWGVTEARVWGWFTSLQKRLGIRHPDTGRPFRVHDLRHTAALRTYRATRDLHRSQVLLGHKSINTTAIYAQERPEDFVASLEGALKVDDVTRHVARTKPSRRR